MQVGLKSATLIKNQIQNKIKEGKKFTIKDLYNCLNWQLRRFSNSQIFKDIKEDGTIEYYGTPNTNKLTSDMKTRILEIAKLVIVVSR